MSAKFPRGRGAGPFLARSLSVNVNEIKGSVLGLNAKITIKAASGENILFERLCSFRFESRC